MSEDEATPGAAPRDLDGAEALIDGVPCGIASTLPSGEIVYANPMLEAWAGAERGGLAGRLLQSLMTLPGRMFFETHLRPMIVLSGVASEVACTLSTGTGEAMPVLVSARRVASDGVERVHFTLFSARERTLYEEELRRARAKAEQLGAIVTSARDAIVSICPVAEVLTWNPGAERLMGVAEEEAIGGRITDLVAVETLEDWTLAAREVVGREGAWRGEGTLLSGPNEGHEVELTVAPVRSPDPVPVLSVIIRDVSEQRRAERHRRLVTAELDHRVKNTLAIVQAIGAQSFRGGATPEGVAAFNQRLQALAGTHDLLTREGWDQVSMGALASATLRPVAGDDQVRTSGPDVMIGAKRAVSLSMALNELATNALKHGALGVAGGVVSLSWEAMPDGGMRMEWRESGGPPVAPPSRTGFGTMMIERALGSGRGERSELLYPPDGVVCRVELPAEVPAAMAGA